MNKGGEIVESVKQKKTFKEKVKDTGRKTKTYVKKQATRAKESAKRYGSALRTAYDIGYARGWDDAYEVPKKFGAKTAAAMGYKKGIRNRRRSDKYINQYGKKGGKK